MLQRGATTVISCVYVDIVKSKAASQLLSVSFEMFIRNRQVL